MPYFDADQVIAKGRRIHRYGDYPPAVPANARLVAICDRGLFKLAADVTDPGEYAQFWNQYMSGMLLSFDLYEFKP